MHAQDEALPFRFSIAAIDLRMLIGRLKPAFPRGKKALATRVVMEVSPGQVRWLLPGAAAQTVAQADQTFRAEVPFAEVQWITKETIRDGEVIQFEFGPGRMNYRGTGVSRPDITAAEGTSAGDGLWAATDTPPAGVVGLPMFAAYCEILRGRARGGAPSDYLRGQQRETDAILDKSEKLLEPLGISRADLEKLLRDRCESP